MSTCEDSSNDAPFVAAASAVTRPTLPLVRLAAELADAAGRWDALDTGDPFASVAVYS